MRSSWRVAPLIVLMVASGCSNADGMSNASTTEPVDTSPAFDASPPDPSDAVGDSASVSCVTNLCGGCASLPARPGDACGSDALFWICRGADDIFCAYAVPPREVRASGDRPEGVQVSWRAPAGATPDAYVVLRDGVRLLEVAATETAWLDTTTEPATVGAPTDLRASANRTDGVALTWTAPAIASGLRHAYGVQARYGTKISATAGDALGFRAAGAITYEVLRDDGQSLAATSVLSALDENAAKASVAGGAASATPDAWRSLVILRLTAEPQVTLAPRSYSVRAVSNGVAGASSVAAIGVRAPGPLEVSWERADFAAQTFSPLPGVRGRSWVDADAPLDDARNYRAVVEGPGTLQGFVAAPGTGVQSIATFALSDGHAYSFGLTANGTAIYRSPDSYDVSGGPFDKVAQTTPGGCGIRTDNKRLKCWGNPWYYSGTFTGAAHDVAASSLGVCIVRASDRTAFCDGLGSLSFGADQLETIRANGVGACGIKLDGTISCRLNADATPNPLEQGPPTGVFADVALGPSGACAIRHDGSFSCWGNVEQAHASIPSTERFRRLHLGYQMICGVRLDDSLACWNATGELDLPRDLAPPNKFRDAFMGFNTLCALRTDGRMRCLQSPLPPLEPMKDVDVAAGRSCGIRTDGTLTCWHGPTFAKEFATVSGQKYERISVGGEHVCARRDTGVVDCFGASPFAVPAALASTTFKSISAYLPPENGAYPPATSKGGGACGVLTTGNVQCWGPNAPLAMNGSFVSVSSNGSQTLAVGSDGLVHELSGVASWLSPVSYGGVSVGSAGSFTTTLRADGHLELFAGAERRLLTAERFIDASAGQYPCGVREDGVLTCWNNHVAPPNGSRWGADRFVRVSARGDHDCGLRSDGHVLCSPFWWTLGEVP